MMQIFFCTIGLYVIVLPTEFYFFNKTELKDDIQ